MSLLVVNVLVVDVVVVGVAIVSIVVVVATEVALAGKKGSTRGGRKRAAFTTVANHLRAPLKGGKLVGRATGPTKNTPESGLEIPGFGFQRSAFRV